MATIAVTLKPVVVAGAAHSGIADSGTVAVTLKVVQVSGYGPRAAAVAVALRPVSVAASAHVANGGAGAVTLPRPLSIVGAAVKANVATGVVTLRKLSPSIAATIGTTNTITAIHPVLKAITVTATGVHQQIIAAVTLKRVTVAVTAKSGLAGTLAVHVTLKRVLPGVYLVNKYANLVYSVTCITGNIYAGGSGIFQFRGRAGLGVAWTITTGSGAIAPLGPSYTDSNGIAFGKYDAGGYTGPLSIGVSYVP